MKPTHGSFSSARVQVILDPMEREWFRRLAADQGLSLSAWLRQAGRDRAASEEAKETMTPKALRAFFKKCDARERTPEPDWNEHRSIIDRSIAHGHSGT